MTRLGSPQDVWTAARLYECFGAISLARIRFEPPPGSATEEDVLAIHRDEDRLYELVRGVLVEKDMGYYESYFAGLLVQWLGTFAREHDLGIVLPPDGMARLAAGLVRIPDVSFVSWERLPGHEIPDEPIPDLPPDLAVEVLGRGNTPQEMDGKLADYFASGVRAVWYVYRALREIRVYSSSDQFVVLGEADTLAGEPVLPGFRLPVAELFKSPRRTG